MAKAKTLKDSDGVVVYPVTKAEITFLSDNTTDVESALNDKEEKITAGTVSQYLRGDKTWQTLDKNAIGLGSVDNTSDATKKTNYTGHILEGDSGFVIGDEIYSYVDGLEPEITPGTTSQYLRGDKTWQTLNKGAVGLSNVDNTSDDAKKAAFTGTIASGNTGFTTGGDVYIELNKKADKLDLATVATTGDYGDLLNVPTNLSDFTNDENYQTATQVETSIHTITDPIDTAINKTFVKDFDLDATPSTVTVKLNKSLENIKTGATSSSSVTLPAASTTQAGVMNKATFDSVQDSATSISSILGGTLAITGIAETPTQAELTAAWEAATSLPELINGAKIYDVDNMRTWTYYENVTTWYSAGAGGSVTVLPWTNLSLGTVKGSTLDGQISAQADGTGTVNGWSDLKNAVADNTTNIETLTDALADKEDEITPGTVTQYFRGDKTWATLDKTAVGLANVDNTSDDTKKTNFTAASISATETKFPTGAQVYAALEDKADVDELPVLYATKGTNTDGAMTQKAVTDELNKCTYHVDDIIVEDVD